MILFAVFVITLFMWPRFILYFFVGPFLGAILGGFVWAMAMFASGCTMKVSSLGVWVLWGMVLSVLYSLIWGRKNGI